VIYWIFDGWDWWRGGLKIERTVRSTPDDGQSQRALIIFDIFDIRSGQAGKRNAWPYGLHVLCGRYGAHIFCIFRKIKINYKLNTYTSMPLQQYRCHKHFIAPLLKPSSASRAGLKTIGMDLGGPVTMLLGRAWSFWHYAWCGKTKEQLHDISGSACLKLELHILFNNK